jgi:arylsulfatase A-like enzyme
MYDSCCKVPLLIKPPWPFGGGIARDEIVNTLDLYATILEVAGDRAWQQPHIEASTLVPLLDNAKDQTWENETFSIIGADPQRNLTMLRSNELKLIRLSRGDDEPLYELYDMNDPIIEVHNRLDDPAYEDRKKRLRVKLDAWWRQQAVKYPQKLESYVKI